MLLQLTSLFLFTFSMWLLENFKLHVRPSLYFYWMGLIENLKFFQICNEVYLNSSCRGTYEQTAAANHFGSSYASF